MIAPHPDDESYGCGGTIARLVNEGIEVKVLVITVGDLEQIEAESKTKYRKEEHKNACRCLGIEYLDPCWASSDHHMLLDVRPQYELAKLIELDAQCSLSKFEPDILLIPVADGFNQDHLAVHRASFIAARPHSRRSTPRVVLGYSIPDETWSSQPEKRSIYVDISDHLQTKLNAINCYYTQLRRNGHPRSIEQVEKLARAHGGEIGVEAAEKFVVYRMIF